MARDLPDFVFEARQSLRSNRSSDLWGFRKTKPEELSLLRSRYRALRLIYLELEPLSDESRNALHHPVTSPVDSTPVGQYTNGAGKKQAALHKKAQKQAAKEATVEV